MAIYHHLPGKSAVLAGITEMIFAEFRVKRIEKPQLWQEQVRAFASGRRAIDR